MQLLHIPMNTWQTLFSFMCPIFGCQKDDGFGQKVKKTGHSLSLWVYTFFWIQANELIKFKLFSGFCSKQMNKTYMIKNCAQAIMHQPPLFFFFLFSILFSFLSFGGVIRLVAAQQFFWLLSCSSVVGEGWMTFCLESSFLYETTRMLLVSGKQTFSDRLIIKGMTQL